MGVGGTIRREFILLLLKWRKFIIIHIFISLRQKLRCDMAAEEHGLLGEGVNDCDRSNNTSTSLKEEVDRLSDQEAESEDV